MATHNMANSQEYKSWESIKQRCFNSKCKDYKHYGARGITMHIPWINSFESFYNHVGPKPGARFTMGRIENDGNYEPGNVEWQTDKTQARNKRNSKIIEFNGKYATVAEWSEITGLKYYTISNRIFKLGWSVSDALSTKPNAINKRCHLLTFNNETHSITEWSKIAGISRNVLWERINDGWPTDRALTEPVHKKNSHSRSVCPDVSNITITESN